MNFPLFFVVIAQFAEHMELTIESIKHKEHINENAFIDSVRLVFEGVRDIRKAVQMRKVCI